MSIPPRSLVRRQTAPLYASASTLSPWLARAFVLFRSAPRCSSVKRIAPSRGYGACAEREYWLRRALSEHQAAPASWPADDYGHHPPFGSEGNLSGTLVTVERRCSSSIASSCWALRIARAAWDANSTRISSSSGVSPAPATFSVS